MISKKTEEYSRINITLPNDVLKKLEFLSKVERRNKSNMICYLIDVAYEGLPEDKKKGKK